MLTTTKHLLQLTAFDLMSRNVVTISQHMSLRAAAHLLAEAEVSGAPVVDEQGRCVGILSATDVMRSLDRAARQETPAQSPQAGCLCCDWEMVDIPSLPHDEVGQYMTRGAIAAANDTRIGELARWMIGAHIHRVIVADSFGKPVGIVTTTDILTAVAREDALAGEAD